MLIFLLLLSWSFSLQPSYRNRRSCHDHSNHELTNAVRNYPETRNVCFTPRNPVDGSEILHHLGCIDSENNGIFAISAGFLAGFLNHQQLPRKWWKLWPFLSGWGFALSFSSCFWSLWRPSSDVSLAIIMRNKYSQCWKSERSLDYIAYNIHTHDVIMCICLICICTHVVGIKVKGNNTETCPKNKSMHNLQVKNLARYKRINVETPMIRIHPSSGPNDVAWRFIKCKGIPVPCGSISKPRLSIDDWNEQKLVV